MIWKSRDAPTDNADVNEMLFLVTRASLVGLMEVLQVMSERGLITRSDLSRIHDAAARSISAKALEPERSAAAAQDVVDSAFAELLTKLRAI